MKKVCLVIALAGVLATGSSAFAGMVALDVIGSGSPMGSVKIVGSGAASGINGNYNAGWVKIALNGGPSFETMCIDIADTAGDDANANLIDLSLAPDAWAGPMGVAAANDIKLLWGKYAAVAQTTQQKAAALQIAIWKIIDTAMGNYSLTFSDGTAGATALANTWIADLGNTPAALMAVTSLNQDFIVPVPEPTTLIAGALLLLPFGASTLRMLRRKA